MMESNFEVTLDNSVLTVKLTGNLDANNSPALAEDLKSSQSESIKEIIFFANELEYIASAGLRVIIFSIQRILDTDGKAYFIGGREEVLSVITMTGLQDSLIIQDTY